MEFDARLTGMRTAVCMLALTAGVMAIAQVPAASRTFTNPLGFSYSIPGDWEVGDASSAQEAAKQKANEDATSPEEKKGLACVEVGLTARHEGSVIVEVALPFDCYGRSFTDAELPGFGEGVAEGIKSTFNVNKPQTSTYALGRHRLWIERATGTPKSAPDRHYTIEISCSLLKKAAVCWMAMAADATALAVFEHGAVTLEDDLPAALVPAEAFAVKPS